MVIFLGFLLRNKFQFNSFVMLHCSVDGSPIKFMVLC